jgi:hypothetical protein
MEIPSYKLIQAKTLETDCSYHHKEYLRDLYNQATGAMQGPWKMFVVDLDKVKFTCNICGSERVYKILL